MRNTRKYLVEVVVTQSFVYEIDTVNKDSAGVMAVREHHEGVPPVSQSEKSFKYSNIKLKGR